MNCLNVQELFGTYWDLPENDAIRISADIHIAGCAECEEQFEIWKESNNLIQALSEPSSTKAETSSRIQSGVMHRIYSDESWRIPVPDRVYSISFGLRKKLSAVIAFCLALFFVSFVYSVMYGGKTADLEAYNHFSGLIPVASAIGDSHSPIINDSGTIVEVPVASISDPLVLKVGPLHSSDYLLVVSIFGLICALLILNWLSRIRV